MFCSLSHVTLGTILFNRLEAFDPGEPHKRASMSATLDGETVHQISKTVHTDRTVSVPMILNRTNAELLRTMNESTSNFIFTLQTGDEVLDGYFKPTFDGNPFPDFFRYNLEFFVTEKRA